MKKVLVEEGHSTPHLVHIWAAIVRHADMFASSRTAFVPQMVNSLQRLGAAPYTSLAAPLACRHLVAESVAPLASSQHAAAANLV